MGGGGERGASAQRARAERTRLRGPRPIPSAGARAANLCVWGVRHLPPLGLHLVLELRGWVCGTVKR